MALLLSISFACKETSTGPGPAPDLSGNLDGWQPAWNNRMYLAVFDGSWIVVLDSSHIAADGSFLFAYPFPGPPDSMLAQFAPEQSDEYMTIQDTRTFTNPQAKHVQLSFLLRDDPNWMLGPFQAGNSFVLDDSLVAVGDYRVRYYYFSEPTTISGQYMATYKESVLIRSCSVYVSDYSVTVSAGWNPITTRVISDDGHTRRYQVAAGDVANKKWKIWLFSFQGTGRL